MGQSCGMAVAGALDWLDAHRDELAPDDVVVILLPDSGFRYLSKTYNDEWMRRNGFLSDAPALTVEEVLAARKQPAPVVAVSPETTLGDAIQAMMSRGISQLPVLDGAEIVGSLSERGVLGRLIDEPGASARPVREVMDGPLAVVSRTVHIDRLTAYLDGDAGAVLVRDEPGGDGEPSPDAAFHIITRSDLISALAAREPEGGIGDAGREGCVLVSFWSVPMAPAQLVLPARPVRQLVAPTPSS